MSYTKTFKFLFAILLLQFNLQASQEIKRVRQEIKQEAKEDDHDDYGQFADIELYASYPKPLLHDSSYHHYQENKTSVIRIVNFLIARKKIVLEEQDRKKLIKEALQVNFLAKDMIFFLENGCVTNVTIVE